MSYTLLNCPHCHAENVGARISHGGQLPDMGDETRYFFTAVCRKCAFPVIIIARRSPGRLPDGPPLVAQVCKTGRDPIPYFIDPIDMIPAPVASVAPDDLPANIASAFSEAKDCTRRGAVLSASMAIHVALERAARALGAGTDASLGDRIAKLVDERGLPSELKEWASEVELLRGAATDAEEDPTAESLDLALGFAEMFLICAFTLPARIENRRKVARQDGGMRALPSGRGPVPAIAGPGPGGTEGAGDNVRRLANPGL
ncbi:MAG TPA: hypothetical protein VLA52_07475 [Thermohalobaculum sp.]|nr:hypothetical protein [Thermohalobaculum sp.]